MMILHLFLLFQQRWKLLAIKVYMSEILVLLAMSWILVWISCSHGPWFQAVYAIFINNFSDLFTHCFLNLISWFLDQLNLIFSYFFLISYGQWIDEAWYECMFFFISTIPRIFFHFFLKERILFHFSHFSIHLYHWQIKI